MIMFSSQSSPRGPHIASGAPQTMLPTHIYIDTARTYTADPHAAPTNRTYACNHLSYLPWCRPHSRGRRFCSPAGKMFDSWVEMFQIPSISTCINHVIICIFIVKQWKDQKWVPARTTVHIFIPTIFVIILISDSVWASHWLVSSLINSCRHHT